MFSEAGSKKNKSGIWQRRGKDSAVRILLVSVINELLLHRWATLTYERTAGGGNKRKQKTVTNTSLIPNILRREMRAMNHRIVVAE